MATDGKKLGVMVVEDAKSGLLTAFVMQYPGVVVQCKNMDELHDKMEIAWISFVNRLNKKRAFEFKTQKSA